MATGKKMAKRAPARVTSRRSAATTRPKTAVKIASRGPGRGAGYPGGKKDVRIKGIAQRAAKIAAVALEKAVAHAEDPSRYPLPSAADAAERRLFAAYQGLSRRVRRNLADALLPRIQASESQRRRDLGDLAGIDLRSSSSVLEQAKKLPLPADLKMTAAELKSAVADLTGAQRQARPVTRAAAQVFDKLSAQVVSLECRKETTWELGKDEISVFAVTIDDTGTAQEPVPIALGKFKAGDLREFSPALRVKTFLLSDDDTFPKAFAVAFGAVETDLIQGGLVTVLALAVFVAGIAAAALLPATGIAFGVIAGGLILNEVFALLKLGQNIDQKAATPVVLESRSDLFELPDGTTGSTSAPETFTLRLGKGEYRITTDFGLEGAAKRLGRRPGR